MEFAQGTHRDHDAGPHQTECASAASATRRMYVCCLWTTVSLPNRLRHGCNYHCLELYNVANYTAHPGITVPLPPNPLLCIYAYNKLRALKYTDYQIQCIIKVQVNYIPIVLKHSSTF